MPTYTQESRFIAIATPLGEDVLLLQSVRYSESLAGLFIAEAELVSESGDVDFDEIIGANVTIRIGRDEATTRYINGVVSRFALESADGSLTKYRATIVPWTWLLSRYSDCRIFQDMTIPKVVEEVFRSRGLSDFDLSLSADYPQWDYCVQYRESDLNFVTRLLEQEGIAWYFRHENGKHALVLTDDRAAYEANAPDSLPYRPFAADQSEDFSVTTWSREGQLQPGVFEHTDYDFIKPRTSLLTRAASQSSVPHGEATVFDFPGEFDEFSDGERIARIRLEELHAQRIIASGTTDCPTVRAGCTLSLTDHPREAENTEYLIVGVSLTASVDAYASSGGTGGGESFSCRFSAIEANVPYRPTRVTPRPIISGPQTAFVVGKDGEEIDCDEHGRVRVRFHWDRLSERPEECSCFIRVAQAWAGHNWGAIFTPRVGHEVIVEFLDGDPDRPIITGRVYNGVAKPPYALPAEKTTSTIKSNSSKGGEGFNEIRFEDKKDEERIFMHAQKDLAVRVLNDRHEWFGRDTHLIIVNDRVESVGQDMHVSITRDEIRKIGRDRHLTVEGKQAIAIVGSHSMQVGEDVAEIFESDMSTEVSGDLYIKAKNIVIEAETNITIKVGDTFVAMESSGLKIGTNGEIVLDAKKDITQKTLKNIGLEATSKLKAKGAAGVTVESPATVDLKGTKTTVNGDGMLTLKGGVVMIN